VTGPDGKARRMTQEEKAAMKGNHIVLAKVRLGTPACSQGAPSNGWPSPPPHSRLCRPQPAWPLPPLAAAPAECALSQDRQHL
jgi:hypothetical protein